MQLRRYRTYAYLLRSKMAQYPELVPAIVEISIGEVDEPEQNHVGGGGTPSLCPPVTCSPPRTKHHHSGPHRGTTVPPTVPPSSGSPRGSPTVLRSKRPPTQDRLSYRTAMQKEFGT